MGAAMSILTRLAACAVFPLLATACNPVDRAYFREGIGTSLYSTDLPAATDYERVYVSHICEQAGFIGLDGTCAIGDWATFVQAGMNDIDRRCDAYLGWLDDRKRSREPILKQIADTSAATLGIMRLTHVGPDPIAIAAIAFGFAANTFTNVNSRLLTELDHSTVQTVVLRRQTEFRNGIKGKLLSTRPDAIHALRQYLRICMPFTIETEINTTITTLERGGLRAIQEQREKPLVSITTVGTVPFRAGEAITRPVRPHVPPVPAFAEFLLKYDPKTQHPSLVRGALSALCVRGSEVDVPSGTIRGLIRIYESSPQHDIGIVVTRDGKLDNSEIRELSNAGDCEAIHRNYYERRAFQDGRATPGFVTLLNRALAPGDAVQGTPSLQDIREKIRKARGNPALAARLDLQSAAFSDHITPDLIAQLRALRSQPGGLL
jgi:hypothetical protein